MSLLPYFKKHMKNSFSTFTNASYLVVAVLVIGVSPWLAALNLIVGAASIGFHWTRSRAWHKFDIVAIIYLFAGLLGWFIHDPYGIFGGLVVAAVLHYFYHQINYRLAIGILGGLCLMLFSIDHSPLEIYYVVGSFAFAFLVSTLAEAKIAEEDGIIYDALHGIWHIFSAMGIYYLIAL